MARVPQHFRSKLVSSQTAPNTLDTSAADSARAITQMANNFQVVAKGFEEKKRKDLMASEGAKVQADYRNQYALASRDIMKAHAQDPDGGFAALQEKEAEIRDSVLSGVSDSRLRSDLGPIFNSMSAQKSVDSTAWKIGQMDIIDRKNLTDTLSTNIDTLMQTGGATEGELDDMLTDKTFTEEHYIRTFGLKEGPGAYKTAKNAMFTARASVMLEEGRFFAADAFIEQSELPDNTTRSKLNKSFVKMQKGAEALDHFRANRSGNVALVEAATGMTADKMSAAELEDMVLKFSEESQAAKEAGNPRVAESKRLVAETLANIRDIKQENTLLTAAGNTDVEAELQFGFEQLFLAKEDGKTTKDPNAFLSDFIKFQKNVSEQAKAGNVSAAHYNKWMWWTKIALQDVQDVDGDFDLENRFNSGAQDLDRNDNKILVTQMRQFLLDDTNGYSPTQRMQVLQDVYDNIPEGQEKNIVKSAAEALFEEAKGRTELLRLGYPISSFNSKMIKTSAGTFPWAGRDQDGKTYVNIDASELKE